MVVSRDEIIGNDVETNESMAFSLYELAELAHVLLFKKDVARFDHSRASDGRASDDCPILRTFFDVVRVTACLNWLPCLFQVSYKDSPSVGSFLLVASLNLIQRYSTVVWNWLAYQAKNDIPHCYEPHRRLSVMQCTKLMF
jgi:hypothetical protein